MSRRLLIGGLLAGALIRLAALPIMGTGDVGQWKIWSFAASNDVTGVYGVGGTPLERRELHWRGQISTTDYPPLAMYETAIVGRIYRAIDPLYSDSAWLVALLKLPGILAEALFVFAVLRWGPTVFGDGARWAALAFWLNPVTLLNGPFLGYFDAQMAVPAALAFIAAAIGAMPLAGALAAVAIATKAQAIFALPLLAVACWKHPRGGGLRGIGLAAAGGAAVLAAILLPFALRGALANVQQAVGRLATHDMLSANNANVWWIVTWFTRGIDGIHDFGAWASFTKPVRILGITAFARFFAHARLLASTLVVGALCWALWRARTVRTAMGFAALAAWFVYAYTVFNVQVHENHLYLAIPLLAIAAAEDRRLRAVFWCVSLVGALNLYLFYGLGANWPSIISRTSTWVDVTVLLAFVNVGVFGWLTRKLFF